MWRLDRHSLHVLALVVKSDLLVRGSLVGLVTISITLSLLASPPSTTSMTAEVLFQILHFGLLLAIVGSLIWRLDQVERGRERSFWWRVALAYICWLVGASFVFLPEPLGPFAHRPLKAIVYSLVYIFMIRAVELRPHRASPRTRSERLLTWPAVTFFVLGLTIYFIFIPLSSAGSETPLTGGSPQAPIKILDDFLFYALIDLYLSIRLLLLAHGAATRKWRTLYFALALPWLGIFLTADLGTIAEQTAFVWPSQGISEWWLLFPFVLQILATRTRHYPFVREWTSSEPDSPIPGYNEQISFMVSARTLTLGVLFPMIHILFLRFQLVQAPSHDARQTLVLAWLVFFGIVALIQHRHLERGTQKLWLEQMRFEEDLRASEQDLRLIIERGRASEVLEKSEQKFDLAFRSCPYTLMITRLDDGRCLEINPAFSEMFGHHRSWALGRNADQLELWKDPDVPTVRRLIEGQDQIQEVEITFRRPSGTSGQAVLSVAPMEIGGQRCLLLIVRDITQRRQEEKNLQAMVHLMSSTSVLIIEIDAANSISSWNRAAEDLSGWTANEVAGRDFQDFLVFAEDAPQLNMNGEIASISMRQQAGTEVELRGWRIELDNDAGSLIIAG